MNIRRFLLLGILLLLNGITSLAQFFDVDTLQYNGNINDRINLVILGDGYQEHELSQFADDASVFSDYFFSIKPYKEYKSYFNVFIIKSSMY